MEPFCGECAHFFPVEGTLCDRCGSPRPQDKAVCGLCEDLGPIDRLRSGLWLKGGAKTLFYRIKFSRRWEYFLYLRPFICYDNGDEAPFVPVPKFSWVPLLSMESVPQYLAEKLGKQNRHLSKIKHTTAQKEISSRSQRRKNLRGAFRWTGGPMDKVILVDDVFTSGGTLVECAKTLKRGGVKRVEAWTLFRTPR